MKGGAKGKTEGDCSSTNGQRMKDKTGKFSSRIRLTFRKTRERLEEEENKRTNGGSNNRKERKRRGGEWLHLDHKNK